MITPNQWVFIIIIFLAFLVVLYTLYESGTKVSSRRKISVPINGNPNSKDMIEQHEEIEPVRSPLFPMRQILLQITLIKDHCIPQRRCYECIAKHMVNAEMWSEFGAQISAEDVDNYAQIAKALRDKLLEIRRKGVDHSTITWMEKLEFEITKTYPNLDEEAFSISSISDKQYTDDPLLPLRNPLFNLREILKVVQRCEQTLAHPGRKCSVCMRSLLLKGEAFALEGAEMSSQQTIMYTNIAKKLREKLIELEHRTPPIKTVYGDIIVDRGQPPEQTSQWFREFRKEINSSYPELHEMALLGTEYVTPKHVASCSDTCAK